jgi:hypothetical protein
MKRGVVSLKRITAKRNLRIDTMQGINHLQWRAHRRATIKSLGSTSYFLALAAQGNESVVTSVAVRAYGAALRRRPGEIEGIGGA